MTFVSYASPFRALISPHQKFETQVHAPGTLFHILSSLRERAIQKPQWFRAAFPAKLGASARDRDLVSRQEVADGLSQCGFHVDGALLDEVFQITSSHSAVDGTIDMKVFMQTLASDDFGQLLDRMRWQLAGGKEKEAAYVEKNGTRTTAGIFLGPQQHEPRGSATHAKPMRTPRSPPDVTGKADLIREAGAVYQSITAREHLPPAVPDEGPRAHVQRKLSAETAIEALRSKVWSYRNMRRFFAFLDKVPFSRACFRTLGISPC